MELFSRSASSSRAPPLLDVPGRGVPLRATGLTTVTSQKSGKVAEVAGGDKRYKAAEVAGSDKRDEAAEVAGSDKRDEAAASAVDSSRCRLSASLLPSERGVNPWASRPLLLKSRRSSP